MGRYKKRINSLEQFRVNKLEDGKWYKVGMGTTHIYVVRAGEPVAQGRDDFIVQYTDQIRFAVKGERIVSAQGITFQRSWTETLNNATYGHYPYEPTEEDLRDSFVAIFNPWQA